MVGYRKSLFGRTLDAQRKEQSIQRSRILQGPPAYLASTLSPSRLKTPSHVASDTLLPVYINITAL